MRRDRYDRVAERITLRPTGPLHKLYRHWIVQYHIRYGQMPPVELRADWPNVPSWAKPTKRRS